MKRFLTMCLAVGLVGLLAGLAYAGGPEPVSAAVSAKVDSPTLSIALKIDSSCTGSETLITLTPDSEYPAFMIAPNRADMNKKKNWHYVEISANKDWKLEVYGSDNLMGTADPTNLIPINNMRYWYSGTWAGNNQVTTSPTASTTEIGWLPIGTSGTPKLVYTCNSDTTGAKSYMQYQLDIASANADTYSGTITYQVTDGLSL